MNIALENIFYESHLYLVGNHEGAPCNIFPQPYVKEDNIEWLYTSLAKNWTATGLPLSLVPDIQK